MTIQTQIPPAVLEWIEELQKQAYQKGWDEATAALVQAAASARPGNGTVVKGKLERKKPKISAPQGGESNRERVLRALKNKPGMRLAEIARYLTEEDSTVNRLSILTTAKRMHKDRTLRKRGNKLFINDTPEQNQEAA